MSEGVVHVTGQSVWLDTKRLGTEQNVVLCESCAVAVLESMLALVWMGSKRWRVSAVKR